MALGDALDDAFWQTFRDAHPEVDLVLLPDPALTARPSTATAHVEPEHVERIVAGLLDELDDHLAGTPGWPVVLPRTLVWRHDATRHAFLESRVVVTDLETDRTVPLLRAVGNAFLAAGWQARPADDDPPRLVARRESWRAVAQVTADSLQVVLRSGLLPAEEPR